jgi:hypothetical protein
MGKDERFLITSEIQRYLQILDDLCHLNCDESLEIAPYTCTQNLFIVAKLLHLEAIRLHAWINI